MFMTRTYVLEPDCGRTLWQSQSAPAHGSSAACPDSHSELALCGVVHIERESRSTSRGELPMFNFQELFQWDRFITPTIIKTFYWLVIALIVLFGIAGIFSGLAAMAISPFGGFIQLLSSIASVIVSVIFSRITAELILIVFRINEHLGAIRDQGFRQ
jgi:ABC-type sugar transport system permease subunit